MDDRVDVGVLGATGAVGQRLIRLLEKHPCFRLAEVCGSGASAGRTLAERLGAGADGLSSETAELRLQAPDGPWTSSILLSALPSEPAQELEVQLAEAGHLVVSNAAAHRMGELVPLIIPEVNADHLDLVARQPWSGALVTNPNCAAVVFRNGRLIRSTSLWNLGITESFFRARLFASEDQIFFTWKPTRGKCTTTTPT